MVSQTQPETRVVGVPAKSDDAPLERGARLGRYQILETVGVGGMGVVYAATDPELNRRVAIKVLRRDRAGTELDSEGVRRFLREARAMAALSHPNVIEVYDVGVVEGRAFVAMELVDGVTLRTWLKQAPPTKAILDAFGQAGRGLAAAHASGLVHRDFKPSNVVMGPKAGPTAPGRVRVLDFGIARFVRDSAGSHASDGQTSLAPDDTHSSAIMGTPRYMAPEQRSGGYVDAVSDQYSFCVALHEALVGRLPSEPASGSDAKVTPRIMRAIERGLQREPHARWPSMSELLRALEPRGASRGLPWVVGVSVAGTVSVLALAGEPATDTRCSGGEARADAVWNAERRAEAEAALLATGRTYVSNTWERAGPRLDDHVQEWVHAHAIACADADAPASLLDIRMACLDRQLDKADALIAGMLTAEDSTLEEIPKALDSLGTPPECLDPERLAGQVRPPADAETAALVEQLRRRISGVDAAVAMARHDEVVDEARSILDEAQALNYEPVQAEALYALARVEMATSPVDVAPERLEDAALLATGCGHDSLAVAAMSRLVYVEGFLAGRSASAARWERRVESELARLGGNPKLRMEFEVDRGLAAYKAGRLDEAEEHLAGAYALALERDGPSSAKAVDVSNNLGVVALARGDLDEGRRFFQRSLGGAKALYGVEHPHYAGGLHNLGLVDFRAGKLEDAVRRLEQAFEVYVAAYGPDHIRLASVHSDLGQLLLAQGDKKRAGAHIGRGLEIRRTILPADSPDLAAALVAYAVFLKEEERFDEAQTASREAVSIFEAIRAPDDLNLARARWILGLARQGQGHGREALDLLRQAEGPLAKAVPDSVELVQLRVTIAITRWRLDDDRPGTYAALEEERERIRQLNPEHPALSAFEEFFSNYEAPVPG